MDRAETEDGLRIEVVYCAAPGSTDLVRLRLAPGCTLGQAVDASGLLQRHTLPWPGHAGVWGRARPADHVLRDRDRVEIYRPLLVDPKEARRQRYRQQRVKPEPG